MSEPKPAPAIIKRQHVLLAGAEARAEKRAAAAPGAASAPGACGRKSVRFLEEDGVPRAIEFTCACGETTLVELVLESASPTQAGAKTGAVQ